MSDSDEDICSTSTSIDMSEDESDSAGSLVDFVVDEPDDTNAKLELARICNMFRRGVMARGDSHTSAPSSFSQSNSSTSQRSFAATSSSALRPSYHAPTPPQTVSIPTVDSTIDTMATGDADSCTVCCTWKVTVIPVPCGHAHVCLRCVHAFSAPQQRLCVTCREPVKDYIRIRKP